MNTEMMNETVNEVVENGAEAVKHLNFDKIKYVGLGVGTVLVVCIAGKYVIKPGFEKVKGKIVNRKAKKLEAETTSEEIKEIK